jgi:beta-phosphoglucomutase-like phosphatase (HAD superfamily)
VEFVLSHIGLLNSFDVILDSSDVSKGKPDPEIYIKTGARLNVLHARCVVIEDSRNGIIAAKKAGMKVIGITTTHSAGELPEVDLLIKNFDRLNVPMLKNLI